MKFAILGASGQLGMKTLEQVLELGVDAADVVAAVRTPEKLARFGELGVDVRRADYDDDASLHAAFEGVEKLLLIPSMAMPAERAMQYHRAITAARDAGVRHLLHYGLVPTTIESPFLITPFLLFAESALRTSGLEWTVLRNGLYADPIIDWVPDIVEMGTIPYPTGAGRCAYVSREDIARAGAAALTGDGHEGRVYNLTGPAALSTTELCEAVSRVTGKVVVDKDAKDADYIEACRLGDEPERMIFLLLSLYHTIRDGYLSLVSDDIEKLTGRRPASFFELLKR